jgi:hypothetical protein
LGSNNKKSSFLKKIISCLFIIGSFFIGKSIAKHSAQKMYNADLKRHQSEYQVVQSNDRQEIKNEFINDEPYFTINLPEGIRLEKLIDENGIIAYQGASDSIICRISIMDGYEIMNLSSKGYARTQMDYNMYQKKTMDAAYTGTIESTFKSMPYEKMVNREYGINKINDIIFIYIKFEVPDDKGDIVRISYNFLRNGYDIGIIGTYLKNNSDGEKIIKSYLDSIVF